MSVEGSTTCITGTLGGGKSLCAVDMGMDRLARGGTVLSNIPMNRERLAQWMRDEHGKHMDQSRLIEIGQESIDNFQDMAVRGNAKLPTMMLLDEAALDLNARDWKSRTDEEFNFVVLARKLKIDLVFIAQDAADIDKQIRKKMQKEIHCRSLMSMFDEVKVPLFVRVHYSIQLNGKPWRRKVEVKWKAQSWGMFDSYALHGEKAKLYAALNIANDAELEEVVKDARGYYYAVACAAVASGLVTIL